MNCLDCKLPRAKWRKDSVTGRAKGGRGLCATCYNRHTRDGTLVDYTRSTYSRDELLDEWTFLRSGGVKGREAAARLGMSFASFERALHRAKARGDERATGFGRKAA